METIDPFFVPTSQLCHSASWRQNKWKTGGGPFKPAQIRLHKELKISSCCDVGCQNRHSTGSNLKLYRIPAATARQKNRRHVVKRDKMSGLDRNDHQKLKNPSKKMLAFAAHTSYQKRFNKVWSFVVMDYGLCYVSKDFLCVSRLCRVWNVCVHVCKTTNCRFICLIILYIVVIDSGW